MAALALAPFGVTANAAGRKEQAGRTDVGTFKNDR